MCQTFVCVKLCMGHLATLSWLDDVANSEVSRSAPSRKPMPVARYSKLTSVSELTEERNSLKRGSFLMGELARLRYRYIYGGALTREKYGMSPLEANNLKRECWLEVHWPSKDGSTKTPTNR